MRNVTIESSAEEVWIQKAAQGDLEAFNQLVLMYQDMAYNHAYALLADADLSEDATQESFLKAFQNIGRLQGGSLRPWLLKIVTNSAYDLLRRTHRRPTQPLFPMDEDGEEMESPTWMADPNPSVENTVEQKEETEHVYKLLAELLPVYRSVITLIDIDELDYTEAARILNVPLGTVKSRLAQARLQMKEKLSKEPARPGRIDAGDLCLAV